MRVRVVVTLKHGVLDPQGKAIEGALSSLSFGGVNAVRQGKVFDLDLEPAPKVEMEKTIAGMCEKLLTNTVIEDYSIEWPQQG